MKKNQLKITNANFWPMMLFYFSLMLCGVLVWAFTWLIAVPLQTVWLVAVALLVAMVGCAYLAGAGFKRAQLLNELKEAEKAFFSYSGEDPKITHMLECRFQELRMKAGKKSIVKPKKNF